VIPARDIAAMPELLRDRDVMVLSDEIYSRMSYGEPAGLHRELSQDAREDHPLDGFSKTYAMTGWRLGYGRDAGVAGGGGQQADGELQSCTASFTQRCRLRRAAHRHPQDCVAQMMAEFRRRRDAFCRR
jgi:aspartate/methionine/tyrosine aminotransferase